MRLTNVLLMPLLLGLSSIITSFAQDAYLRVGDPRRGAGTRPGTVDEATLVLRPQGVYTAIDMYLTFSAKGNTSFGIGDTLEVVLNFNLPQGSIVNDSWLWIDDLIIKADVYDRWTASNIYENIVNRRRDPSILYRNPDGKYELRIFPMAANKTRQVKISYLVPTQWTKQFVSTALPVYIPKISNVPIGKVRILTPKDEKWGKPTLDNPTINFQQMTDSTGTWWEAILQAYQLDFVSQMRFASPLQKGVYVNRYEAGTGGIYQMVLLPKEILGVEAIAPKKVMLLLDYVTGNSNSIPPADLLSQVKQQMLATLNPRDSFNFLVSKLLLKPYAEHWIAATPQAIDSAFAALALNAASGYSNLAPMLGTAIDFIQQKGAKGSILLFANSGNISTINAANALIEDLRQAMGRQLIPTFIFDFQQQNYNYYNAGNQSFKGNGYFYTNLTRITGGSYVELCCSERGLATSTASIFGSLTALNGALDLYTRLQNGFCYSRYNVNSLNDAAVNFNEPIMQVGKYEGKFPFLIDLSGSLDGNLFSKQLIVNEITAARTDTLAQEIWVGNHLQSLEGLEQSNATISRIIGESIGERVLSRYTAFLCLEPGQGGKICFDCQINNPSTGGPVVDVTDHLALDSLVEVTALPNPFQNQLKLSLKFINNQDFNEYQFAIYNMVGQQVKVFNDLLTPQADRLELVWDADQTLAPGMYFFVIQSPKGRYSLKLIKL